MEAVSQADNTDRQIYMFSLSTNGVDGQIVKHFGRSLQGFCHAVSVSFPWGKFFAVSGRELKMEFT